MITINLNLVKNILKLAAVATLMYLLFNITKGYNTHTFAQYPYDTLINTSK